MMDLSGAQCQVQARWGHLTGCIVLGGNNVCFPPSVSFVLQGLHRLDALGLLDGFFTGYDLEHMRVELCNGHQRIN